VSAALSMAKVMARPQRAHGSTATRMVDAGERTGSSTAELYGGRRGCGLCIVTTRRVFGRKTWRPGHVADATVQRRQRRRQRPDAAVRLAKPSSSQRLSLAKGVAFELGQIMSRTHAGTWETRAATRPSATSGSTARASRRTGCRRKR